MVTSGDSSITINSSVETDGTQILETPLSHKTIRDGMSQFTRETSQASMTEESSQNEQQLPGYSALCDAARKVPSRKRKHPEEEDKESEKLRSIV